MTDICPERTALKLPRLVVSHQMGTAFIGYLPDFGLNMQSRGQRLFPA